MSIADETENLPNGMNAQRPSGRLGRPVDPAKEAKILEAARSAFLEHPYDRISMDALASRAGVSKVTLYAKYKSKDQLFVAAMSVGCNQIYERAMLEAEAGKPLAETLLRLGVDFVTMMLEPEISALHGVMMQALATRPELPRAFFERVVHRSTQILADALALANKRGEIACDDHYRAAVQFIAMVQGEFRYKQELGIASGVDEAELTTFVASCVQVFLRGYAKTPR
ncbi:putative HTH-type transcriptional regulator [Candidatus Phycosocius bacilliformis]|uniref:Putative HTH-type transcriptional regulator n=2 Tax=Candidatus Phycosocius bacilliformis TaxID=1445552 RepID=A0A2P2E965_9PROT|nr:putative HTH-type transcriptional regulator [Candidatus Phycosocius bacilliformis]